MTATTGEALKSCLVWALGRRDPPKDKLMDKLRTLGDQHDRQRARLKALEDGYGAGITQIFRRLSNQSQKLRLKLQVLKKILD